MPGFDSRDFRTFLVLTFVISWGVAGLGIVIAQILPTFPFSLEMYTPFYYVAVWGPAIAALIVIGRKFGLRGIATYLSRMGNWRLGARWWLFIVVGIPAMHFGAAAVEATLLGTTDAISWRDTAWLPLIIAFLLRATAGPVEELGWRGFAQPLLQRRFSPAQVLVIIAVVHTIWHAPAFLIGFASDTHFATGLPFSLALARFAVNITAITVFMNIAYNATGGKLTSAFLIHWMLNGVYPWEGVADLMSGQAIVMGTVAVIMLASPARRWLRRENSETTILP